MFTLRESLVLLSTAASAAASAQLMAYCDGNIQPDYGDCDAVAAYAFPDDTQTFQAPASGTGQNCYEFAIGDQYNCVLDLCWIDSSKAAIGLRAKVDYQIVEQDCSPNHAGGSSVDNNGDGYFVRARYNPAYVPSKRRDADVESEPLRQHSRDMLQKRDDDGFTLVTLSQNVETDIIYPITGRLPAGSMHTIQNTESATTGITYTMDVGVDLFEVFTASVSISVSQDFTTSNTVGNSIYVDCASGQEGIIYWVPLYDVYSGFYTPSRTNDVISIPKDTAQGKGNYMVRCLG